MLDKRLQISALLEFYGCLLSEKQFKILKAYYDEDFSLSEIAEDLSISRQGVLDSIKRSENSLFDFENKLHLLEKYKTQQNNLSSLKDRVSEISRQSKNASCDCDIHKNCEIINKMLDELFE